MARLCGMHPPPPLPRRSALSRHDHTTVRTAQAFAERLLWFGSVLLGLSDCPRRGDMACAMQQEGTSFMVPWRTP
jgi:hypothetical protein